MKVEFALALLAAVVFGCSVQNSPLPLTSPPEQAHPLPFTGRLADGDPRELPPAVAMSLSSASPVSFAYREELTHDDYHIPLALTALDPVTYVGAPLGDRAVRAFASLSITEGDAVIGDYTAKAYVSKPYTLYSEPTHKELEDSARAAVRAAIDRKLYRDSARLAAKIAAAQQAPAGAAK